MIVLAFKNIDSNGKFLKKVQMPSPTAFNEIELSGDGVWALAFKISSLVGASKQPGLNERNDSYLLAVSSTIAGSLSLSPGGAVTFLGVGRRVFMCVCVEGGGVVIVAGSVVRETGIA